jgi:hypothetical protein
MVAIVRGPAWTTTQLLANQLVSRREAKAHDQAGSVAPSSGHASE